MWKKKTLSLVVLICIASSSRNKKDVTIYESLKILICDHWMINFNRPAPFSNSMLASVLCTSLVFLIITENEWVFTHLIMSIASFYCFDSNKQTHTFAGRCLSDWMRCSATRRVDLLSLTLYMTHVLVKLVSFVVIFSLISYSIIFLALFSDDIS